MRGLFSDDRLLLYRPCNDLETKLASATCNAFSHFTRIW
jgi:hypothetical protein